MKKSNTKQGKLGPKLIRIVILLTTATFLVLFLAVAAEMFMASRSREIDNQKSLMNQSAGRITALQNTVSNIASLIVYNDVVQKGISSKKANAGESLYSARIISETLKEYLHLVEGTEEITIYTTEGQILTSRYVRGNMDPSSADWFRDFITSGKRAGFTEVHDSIPMQNGYTMPVISYIMDYYSIEDHDRKLGQLIINVEYQTLLDMLQIDDSTLIKGYTLYNGDHKELVSSGKLLKSPEEILKKEKDGIWETGLGEVDVVTDEMKDGWVLISEISGTALLREAIAVIMPIFVLSLLMLLLMAVILRTVIRRTVNPINELSMAAEKVGHGDFSVNVDIHTGDEVENLAETFNRMVVDINDLMNASVEHEKKIQEMQRENLMLQINPHFIYNTMNSIVYMARMEGNSQIAEFTNAFISLLQNTLRVRKSIYTTLGEELKNVENYLYLQEYRYGNKFEYTIECPEELKGCSIVSVMLQPVVENAIFHGIAPKEGPGRIDILVESEQKKLLRISVRDDGVGMTGETLAQVLREDYEQKGSVHKIGVGNVRARIREIYGEPYGMTVESRPLEGTCVVMTIPYEQDKEGDVQQ